MAYYERARTRAKRVKNPWTLIQIPLVVAGIAGCTWAFLELLLLIIGHFRANHTTLESYSVKNVRDFIVIPLAFAAMPIGMMFSNTVVWLIPPLRKIQETEAANHNETNFRNSMRGLAAFAIFSVPIGSGISALGPVKVNERIEDESDVNEGGEHQVEFLEA
jgi:hypothetical protein